MPLCGACCKLRRCEPTKARVWSLGVVVDPPCFDDPSGLAKVREQVLVEAFVAQPAVERLDEAVLRRLAGSDVMPFHIAILLPSEDGARGQLGAVVADDHAGLGTNLALMHRQRLCYEDTSTIRLVSSGLPLIDRRTGLSKYLYENQAVAMVIPVAATNATGPSHPIG